MEHEYEEFLTPEEIREMYGLEEDEDLVKFIKEANRGHKSKIIIITQPGEGWAHRHLSVLQYYKRDWGKIERV